MRYVSDAVKQGKQLSTEVYEELATPVKKEIKVLSDQEKADRVKAGKGYFSFES